MKNPYKLNTNYLNTIDRKFKHKYDLAKNRHSKLFEIFDKNTLNDEEEFLLKYLYAYMPLHDLADYDNSLFVKHIKKTLEARDKLPWGKDVSPLLMMHYIIPYRTSNENIEDNCRGILFNELYDRVKNLTMHDAIAEVNHWCHEKAAYTGTDPRTVSPLTCMRTTLGRCGELSTLAVAALRSVYIPARQVYTPRWAHCDSNHAWIEGWANKWYFLGASEPEATLNDGWFSGPTRRAMLICTRVATNYPGPEEVTLSHEWFSEVNLMDNYAPSKKITVKVIDDSHANVKGAKVAFEVFNFGEFSPIVRKTTDENGEVTLTTGKGDLLIHASCDKGWGYKKINVLNENYIEICISNNNNSYVEKIDMVPPAEMHENKQDKQYSDEELKSLKKQKELNDILLKKEDQIRADYESTFIKKEKAYEIAKKINLPEERVWKVLESARGNSHEIAKFLLEESKTYVELPLKLLESIPSKDCSDTFIPELKDHLINSKVYENQFDKDIFTKYILCPRLFWEKIVPYKSYFNNAFTKEQREQFKKSPNLLVDWVNNNIQVVDSYVNYRGCATPIGTYELKLADRLSRDTLFVALGRTFGIPSRLEPTDKRPQYFKDNNWVDALFDDSLLKQKQNEKNKDIQFGTIKLIKQTNPEDKIEYFTTFSIAKLEKNIFKTLDFYDVDFNKFENGIKVLPGYYRLVTGNRLTDGTVLTHSTYFTVKPNDTTEVNFIIRKENREIKIHGHINDNIKFNTISNEDKNLKDLIDGKYMILAWLEPDREPTKHLLKELGELSSQFNSLNNNIMLCIGNDKLSSDFSPANYTNLPTKTHFAIDDNYEILNCITDSIKDSKVTKDFPIVFIIDKNYDIKYLSVGYKLGIANDVLKTLKLL